MTKHSIFSALAALGAMLLPALAQSAAAQEFGCIKGSCLDGQGTFVEETELGRTTYQGEFRDGRYHGYGRMTWEDRGAVYKGGWDKGKREGRGTYWVRESGNIYDVYIGQWSNDRRNGFGSQFFDVRDWKENAHTENWLKDHAENYTGSFKNDVFYGEGTYRWTNGTKYVGEWAANQKHGQGYYDYGNGRISRRMYEFDDRVFDF